MVDALGYETVHPKRTRVLLSGRSTLLTGREPTPQVHRKGGPLEERRPLEIAGMFRIFADTRKSETGVLGFANRFGLLGLGPLDRTTDPPLSEDPHNAAENLDGWYRAIDAMRGLIRLLDAQDWPALSATYDRYSLGRMTIKLLPNRKNDGLEAVPVPNTLLQAMWLQLAQSASVKQAWRRCQHHQCGTWFVVGHGTGRRSTALYCSDRCRKAAFFERKAKEAAS